MVPLTQAGRTRQPRRGALRRAMRRRGIHIAASLGVALLLVLAPSQTRLAHAANGNTVAGNGALASDITGTNNTAAGASALSLNTTGGGNTALGYSARDTGNFSNVNTAGSVRQPEQARWASLPLSFEPNRGQTATAVAFLARQPGYTAFLTKAGIVLDFARPRIRLTEMDRRPAFQDLMKGPRGSSSAGAVGREALTDAAVRISFPGASAHTRVVGSDRLLGRVNYFLGRDPRRWHTDIPTFAEVLYRNIYPGIDLLYHGASGRIEYDWLIKPGANPREIRFRIAGSSAVHLDGQGDLVTRLGQVLIEQQRPVAYQWQRGGKQAVAVRYRLLGRTARLEVGSYDRAGPLVIDPVISYSTYLGGSGDDGPGRIAADAGGNAYLVGDTNSPNFPTAQPLQAAKHGGTCQDANGAPTPCSDAFVTKINAAGNALVYSTYLGGSGDDHGYGIAIDGDGDAYVSGPTTSTDFPVQNAFQPKRAGSQDAFVAKLSPSGDRLVYSTYLGGPGGKTGGVLTGSPNVAVDPQGEAYVAGETTSPNLPFNHPLRPYAGSVDCFVAKLNAAGNALLAGTYLGGSQPDSDYAGVKLDKAGNVYVAGETGSNNDFPVANAIQTHNNAPSDTNGWVTKLDPTLSTLLYSTYLGGSVHDQINGLAVDAAGNAYVGDHTASPDLPTTSGAYQAHLPGSDSAWMGKLSPTGILVYGTYFGGTASTSCHDVAVDTSGDAYCAGWTTSVDLPLKDAVQHTIAGDLDAIVAKFNPTGTGLIYSTYLGGSAHDNANGIALDGHGNPYISIFSLSADIPTVNALQPRSGGGADAWIVKLDESQPTPPIPLTVSLAHQTVKAGQKQKVTVHTLAVAAGIDVGIVVSFPNKSKKTTKFYTNMKGVYTWSYKQPVGTSKGSNHTAKVIVTVSDLGGETRRVTITYKIG